MFDVLGDFTERATQIELTLPEASIEREIYRRIIDNIDAKEVWSLQDRYRAKLDHFISGDPTVDRGGPEKYFDIPLFISERVRAVLGLGLLNVPPMSILDIGVGPGHFAAICNALGHQTLGIDIETEYYAHLCLALGVERKICPVFRLERLPDFGKKFDLVTAIWICFDQLGEDARGHRIYWSLKDWRYLLQELFFNHISENGEIYFILNPQVNKVDPNQFDGDLLDAMEGVGAEVDRTIGSIRLKKGVFEKSRWSQKYPSIESLEFKPGTLLKSP